MKEPNITCEVFGFPCMEFEFLGRAARLIIPRENKNGKWLLKTEYADAFPALEIEMLKRGYHVAYVQNKTRWWVEEDSHVKAKFAEFLHTEYGLSKKCVPVGMSCGGMHAIYFAALHPEYIAALYVDAPVTNLLSCPGKVGRKVYTDGDFLNEFTSHTGMTLSDLINYRNHPIDVAPKLVEAGLPLFMVSGDSDTVVPYHENGALLEKLYRNAGVHIEVAIKKGGDHHPHLLPDNTPIIAFIEKYYK